MEAAQITTVKIVFSELTPEDVPPFEHPLIGGMVQLTDLELTYQQHADNRVRAYVEGRGYRYNRDGTLSRRTATVHWRYHHLMPSAIEALVDKYQNHAEYVIETAAGSSWLQEVQP